MADRPAGRAPEPGDRAPAARPTAVVGVGAGRGVTADEVLGLVRECLRDAGLAPCSVRELATVDAKRDEPGVVGAAARLGVPLVTYPAHELARVAVPNPSGAPLAAAGTPSVAEAAALVRGGELLVPKRKSARVTCAVARARAAPGPAPPPPPAPPFLPTLTPTPTKGTVITAMDLSTDTTAAGAAGGDVDLRHHGDAEVRGRDDLVDLAVNVRSDTPPSWLKQHIAASLDGLAAYPDGRAARAAVAARHGVEPERVLLTAGAAEAFVLLARALPVRRPVVVHPQFTEPEAALRDAGHTVERVLLRAADGFRLDPAAVPDDADLVVVGNPTNPTSVLHPAADLARLARPGRVLVVDEAFMDAVPGEREALAGRVDVPGLVVLRSLTKTWGLAGLRIGYVIAAPETIRALERAQPLWPVSSPALAAAEACVAPRALAEAGHVAHRVAAERQHLVAGLRALPGVEVVGPAEGPFVLVRLAGAATVVRERLREEGFMVRRGDTFPGLGPDWMRVAVRDRPTTEAFLRALPKTRPH
ncbi:Rv2231c family pyridoxal phosphate-dependent protein CobC [Streptomyces sp. AN091965]|uniref:Rv2231c family pyridoxal phosphate-dependent protein CobC n=1 Tax=Streptomyces sp. AN091965 TaxID=2927803 RepID=UPI001F60B8F1|nr:Rv2231c family pyridoxal phosphate-dependent protein CobC [Streptomyces sp. AN091965]MCI3929796.1 Rv2231c family pyridoxal phosphate-dependent protein CobC [Streptomyces sp. AN091965]